MSASGLRRRTPVAALAAFAAVVALGMSAAPSSAAPKPKAPKTQAVQLLSFNDYHGHIQPDAATSSDGQIKNEAGVAVPAGGAAYLSTHLTALRAGHANSFTVAAGDLIGGSTFESGVFHDEPSVETLNAMHLDVSSVGNHEFDEGVTELLRMQNGGCHPVDGCYFPEPFAGADYQYLAANVVDTATGNTILPSTSIKTVGNTRIGFIGMTLEGTDTLVAPSGIRGIDFQDEIEAGNRAAAALKKQGVKAIVVLLHEGGIQAAPNLYNGCTGMSGPIVDIAKGLDPQIDALITGHTHAAYNCTIPDPAGVPRKVVSAMSFGRIITEMNFQINTASGDVMRNTVTAVNHIVTRDAEDPAVKSIVDRWVAKSAVQGARVVGSTAEPIGRAAGGARDKESALSSMIADAQLASTAGEGAQIAFMNAGGVRADLDAGDVTYKEAFNVQPFSNILQTFTMTGAAIEQVLEQQWLTKDSAGADVHRVLRLGTSAGFTYAWSASAPDGNRIDPTSIKLNGVTLDPAGSYRVTASNFLADGGDAYGAFAQNTNRVGGKVDLDALIDYLGAHPGITAPIVPRSTPLP